MLTRLLVNRLLVNIAYIKIWVHLTFVLVHLRKKVSLEPCWPANWLDLKPIENLWGIVKRKMRNRRPKNVDELKATVKETWASIPPQQCHKLITSEPLPSIVYIYSKLTYFPDDNNSQKNIFLLVLWSILICWEWICGFLLNVSQNHHN